MKNLPLPLLALALLCSSAPAFARCDGKVVRDSCDTPYCCPKNFAGSDPDPSVCTPPKGGPNNCHGGGSLEKLFQPAASGACGPCVPDEYEPGQWHYEVEGYGFRPSAESKAECEQWKLEDLACR